MRLSWMILAAALALPNTLLTGAAQASEAEVVKRLTERAEAGDTAAQLDLAFHYWESEPNNNGLALKWFRAAADAGDSEGIYELGLIQRGGYMGQPKDWAAGMALIVKAAEMGHGGAQYEVTNCCGWDGDRDPAVVNPNITYPEPEDGVERLRWDWAWTGDASSLWAIDACYGDIDRLQKAGYGDGMAEFRSRFQFHLDAALEGKPGAAGVLASDYIGGYGVKPDLKAAETWFRVDADEGDLGTQMALADHYAAGDFGAPDPVMALVYDHRAADLLRPKAESGDLGARFTLAGLYENERLGAQDSQDQAFALYRSAALANHAQAQSALSRMYFAGSAAPKNNARGLYWLTRAANNMEHPEINGPAGDSNSLDQFALGKIYLEGKLAPQDWYQADYWYELGMSNYQGDVSHESFAIADAQEAATKEARKHLTEDQLAAIRKAVDDWNARAKTFNDDGG